MKSIPTFALAGDPNVGKSTVVATLAENDAVEIARRAGTTREATTYKAEIDGEPILCFIDLPGFENSAQMRAWFDHHKEDSGDPADQFIREHQDLEDFRPECEILRSLKDTAVLFVCDASRPVEERDRDQAEALRLCTDKRMAIINVRDDQPEPQDEGTLGEWKKLLGQNFTYRFFNPQRANFQDRIHLLEGISHVVPGWHESMQHAIGRFRDDWENRLKDTADEFLELIENVLTIREHVALKKNNKAAAAKTAKKQTRNKIRSYEKKFRENIRSIFKHHRPDWEPPDGGALDDDLFSEATWTLFGLNTRQLVSAGAAMGAAIGVGLDLLFAGLSFGIFAATGAVVGSVGAWLTADKAVDVKLPGVGIPGTPFQIPLGRIRSSKRIEAAVTPGSNLLWILIDRALLYIGAAANRAHGRRDELAPADDDKAGITSRWDKEQRKKLIDWMGIIKAAEIGKGKADLKKARPIEVAAQDFIHGEIERVTSSNRPGTSISQPPQTNNSEPR